MWHVHTEQLQREKPEILCAIWIPKKKTEIVCGSQNPCCYCFIFYILFFLKEKFCVLLNRPDRV